MRKYAAILSYFGLPFSGFQRQNKGETVQGKVEEIVSVLLDTPTTIKAAGRTDAGVHAKGQVIAFLSNRELDTVRFMEEANRLLPPSIAFNKLLEVPMDFDPRHKAQKKEYVYRFYLGNKDPLLNQYSAYIRKDGFDLDVFFKALDLFKGEHDFSNFTSKPSDKDGFIRDIETIDIVYDETSMEGSIRFISNGFMTYQIRYMVGEAILTGRGKHTLEELREMLERKPRKVVSAKAPAEGLCLERVYYGQKLGL